MQSPMPEAIERWPLDRLIPHARNARTGTTMIAAERAGRRARVVELDPKYVDVIVQRWEVSTGGKASRTPAN